MHTSRACANLHRRHGKRKLSSQIASKPTVTMWLRGVLSLLLVHLTLSLGLSNGPLDTLPSPNAALPPALTDVLNTLATLARKPTCYRTAATALVQHCKTLPADIPDSDRIEFAIKLTICELDLIGQTPGVCRFEARCNECVKALARKDHWWTTFSGNLREVANVCWIGRHEVEKGSNTHLWVR